LALMTHVTTDEEESPLISLVCPRLNFPLFMSNTDTMFYMFKII